MEMQTKQDQEVSAVSVALQVAHRQYMGPGLWCGCVLVRLANCLTSFASQVQTKTYRHEYIVKMHC